MVVMTSTPSSLRTNLNSQFFPPTVTFSKVICKTDSHSLLFLRQIYGNPSRANNSREQNYKGFMSVKAYMENSNSISSFATRVIGALPVIGLVARILADEGGVGGDVIDFAEFRRRVGKNCSISDSRAFVEFQDRRGRAGDPLYVLMCCYLAAVGAGLLKSEEILEGVARLRISNDIEFEEETFLALMNETRERRSKSKASVTKIPMELRAEKALEAIYVCCFGNDPIEEEDERLLNIMLIIVFPSVDKSEIQRIVKDRIEKVAQGIEMDVVSEPKPLTKEAIEMQMKDLQFLRQNSDS